MATYKLTPETIAAIILFMVIAYILVGPYLFAFVKGSILKWSAPNIAEANSYSLAICEYRQGRAEYPFQWSSKSDGTLNLIAAGLSDCDWIQKAKAVPINVLRGKTKTGDTLTSCSQLDTSCSAIGGACEAWDPINGDCNQYEVYEGKRDCGSTILGTPKGCCVPASLSFPPSATCPDIGGKCENWDPINHRCNPGELPVGRRGCSLVGNCCVAATSTPAPITAYLVPDPDLPSEEQYLFSEGNTYKIIAHRIGNVELPDVCMCLTTDLQRHECW